MQTLGVNNLRIFSINPLGVNPTSQNGQTHSNNLLAKADKLFDDVWPFYGGDAFKS